MDLRQGRGLENPSWSGVYSVGCEEEAGEECAVIGAETREGTMGRSH